MDHAVLILILVVVLTLLFDFTNGFNDSANQVATVITSRALSPEAALTLAAVANFIGAYFLGTNVAETIGKEIVDPQLMNESFRGALILINALVGALVWNLLTWRFGIPSSSSHALIGGLLGAFIAGWGTEPVQWRNVRNIVLIMLVSPFVGFFLTYIFTKITFFVAQWASPKANEHFKQLQIVSSVTQALSHGTNDAQKTMGVIVFALILLKFYPTHDYSGSFAPKWVIGSCSLAMALGTAIGGWRTIRTLGAGLYRVKPIHGFGSQTVSSAIIYATSFLGFPISTTQVISSSIMGAGAAFRPKSIRWELAGEIVIAWLITIPVSALVAAGTFKITEFIFL